jgi:hypothetical protein
VAPTAFFSQLRIKFFSKWQEKLNENIKLVSRKDAKAAKNGKNKKVY